MHERFSDQDGALLALGKSLQDAGYKFTTTTPATHALVNSRAGNRKAKSLIDVFGWSRPFEAQVVPQAIIAAALAANVLEETEEGWRSRVRLSSLGSHLFIHSSFPTAEADAVFFGPDTYRFARFLDAVAARWDLPVRLRVVDVGCGSGAGGIRLSHRLRQRCDVDLVLSDINREALRFARINAELNDCAASVVESNLLDGIDGRVDIVIANPPYLVDAAKRAYRHGGGEFGGALSVRIVEQSLARLRPRGRLALYTASAIVDGVDTFWHEVKTIVDRSERSYSYEEIDPDVFGEELNEEAYAGADRIAVVALSIG